MSQFYRGLFVDGYKHPAFLATFDVILTTYEVLRREFTFVNLNKPMALRRKRARDDAVASSPLLCLHWWRVLHRPLPTPLDLRRREPACGRRHVGGESDVPLDDGQESLVHHWNSS